MDNERTRAMLLRFLLQSLAERFDSDAPSREPDLINLVISQFPEEDTWELGSSLISDDDDDVAILGILLVRELLPFQSRAARLVSDQWTFKRSKRVQYWLLCAFHFLPSDHVIEKILGFRDDSDARVRDAVATALGNSAGAELPRQAVDALLVLSEDLSDEVRFSAIFEIAQWSGQERDARLRSRLDRARSDRDGRVAAIATEAMS